MAEEMEGDNSTPMEARGVGLSTSISSAVCADLGLLAGVSAASLYVRPDNCFFGSAFASSNLLKAPLRSPSPDAAGHLPQRPRQIGLAGRKISPGLFVVCFVVEFVRERLFQVLHLSGHFLHRFCTSKLPLSNLGLVIPLRVCFQKSLSSILMQVLRLISLSPVHYGQSIISQKRSLHPASLGNCYGT